MHMLLNIQKISMRKYKLLIIKAKKDALFLKFILVKNSTCFGQICCPSLGVSALYTQQKVFVMLVMLTVR